MAFFIRLFILIIVLSILWRLIKIFLKSNRSNYARKSSSSSTAQASTENPYKILEVSENATNLEIKEAYRQKLKEYHPDKVNHMGAELGLLAEKKTAEIIDAFERIKRLRNDLS